MTSLGGIGGGNNLAWLEKKLFQQIEAAVNVAYDVKAHAGGQRGLFEGHGRRVKPRRAYFKRRGAAARRGSGL